MSNTYDSIVIGAGGIGSAAAYYLSKADESVLLLEQFELDHSWGSSYGHSRLIRYAYDYPEYVAMAQAVYPLWDTVQAESGVELLVRTGGLDFGDSQSKRFAAVQDSLRQQGIPFEVLSPQDIQARFPLFHLHEGMIGIYTADAGLVKPSLSVVAHVRLAQQQGADLIENCWVESVTPSSVGVKVTTSCGVFSAARLVVTAGAWAKELLAGMGISLPLQVTREQLVLFDAYPPNCPVYIHWTDGDIFYGIGAVDGHGFKCAQHGILEPTTVDAVNRTPDEAYIRKVRRFLARYLPDVAPRPVTESRVCLYTNTPDGHFIVDRLPDYPHIALGAGFSGHGFKFSTLIGSLLADMVLSREIALDLHLFQIDRFG